MALLVEMLLLLSFLILPNCQDAVISLQYTGYPWIINSLPALLSLFCDLGVDSQLH